MRNNLCILQSMQPFHTMEAADLYDLFLSDNDNIDNQYCSLDIDDFQKLVIEFIRNKDIKDGTSLCFQVFCKYMSHSIHQKTFQCEYPELSIVLKGIQHLQKALKFSSSLFFSYLIEEFVTLPVEILWWLHKNDIIYFVPYCYHSKFVSLPESLLTYIAAKKQHSIFIYNEIVPDLIAELLRHAHTPTRLFHLPYHTEWKSYCRTVLNKMVDSVLDVIFCNRSESFLNFFCYIQNLDVLLPRALVKDFFKTILKKLMSYNIDEFDVYSAYTYQELWKSNRISSNLFITLKEIFIKHCIFQDIIDIIEDLDGKVNWKYTLVAVAVCVKESPSGSDDAKDVISQLLQQYLKKPKFCSFIKCLLFVRQTCMEENFKMDYPAWYSLTFGSRSNFKRKCSEAKFKLLISALIELVQYESDDYLKVQLSLSLDAPLMCNYLVHNYKSLCKARLNELDKSPSVSYWSTT
ncbi:hypothetical protein RI129_011589 [Pyrocoelia pectoralis]|uniref:Fanconi anaemia group A protein N-terminal domain-containing protein n=1 Tax=Pyrocoelia pectoralis TaxID=417401 RepID=A0AAN7ZDE8_9COLE